MDQAIYNVVIQIKKIVKELKNSICICKFIENM